MKKVIVIIGPTGVGKTKMSIELAHKLNGEIINADSTQIYKSINIGTAKITEEEKENVPHHLIDIISLDQEYSVYDYQIDGRILIEDIVSKGKTPIIVGGSGLYLSALLFDYKFSKENNIYDFDSLSNQEMYDTLMKIDNTLVIDKNNRQRLIGTYAKYINNSESITKDNGGTNLVYDCLIIGLTTDRALLYKLINRRTDKMIENGLIHEARKVLTEYPNSKQLKNVIGYKEFLNYIDELEELDMVIAKIKQNSRNYAKRQYTWFNHKMDVKWFDTNFDNFDATVNEVYNYIKGLI